MRILYVCADRGIPMLGNKGASVHLRSIAAAMAQRGNQVVVACANTEGDNPIPAGTTVKALPADEGRHTACLECSAGR